MPSLKRKWFVQAGTPPRGVKIHSFLDIISLFPSGCGRQMSVSRYAYAYNIAGSVRLMKLRGCFCNPYFATTYLIESIGQFVPRLELYS